MYWLPCLASILFKACFNLTPHTFLASYKTNGEGPEFALPIPIAHARYRRRDPGQMTLRATITKAARVFQVHARRCCSFDGAAARNNPSSFSSFSLRTHTCGELCRDHVGETVELCGWTGRPRLQPAHGFAFLRVHDAAGATQFVCELDRWRDLLDSFSGNERVVKVSGVVRPRPTEAVNTTTPTGEIEVEMTSLEVINESSHHPFSTFGRVEKSVSLQHQLRERPHFLRLPQMQRNLRLRSRVAMAMREFLVHRHGFLEVETPTLFRRTPEGAQEFIVPTRTHGKFFSLAQSPQQFKQLLMVAGFDRYFQFARCYRDEDLRSDRQPEFTQLDLEMAFVDQDCIMGLTEALVHSTVSFLCPQFSIPPLPFQRMEYRHAMETYGSDKPDTRYGLHLQSLSLVWGELLRDMGVEGGEEGSALNPHFFALKIPGWHQAIEELEKKNRGKAGEVDKRARELCHAHSLATMTTNEGESRESLEKLILSSIPSALLSIFSNISPSLVKRLSDGVREELSYQDGDLCVLGTSEKPHRDKMLTGLGNYRGLAANVLQLTNRMELDSESLNFLWVTDFPLFCVEQDKKRGVYRVLSTHHPFTAPADDDSETVAGKLGLDQLNEVCYTELCIVPCYVIIQD